VANRRTRICSFARWTNNLRSGKLPCCTSL
jgi:hypothetical protein